MKKHIGLLIASLFLCIAYADQDNSTNNDENLVISKNVMVTANKLHEASTESAYTIDIKYPQIKGNKLSSGAKEFNTTVNKIVKEETEQFKKIVALDSAHMKTLPEELRKNTFTMDYDVDVVKPKGNSIISVRLSVEGLQAGRAHPYHTKRVINFDLNKQKLLTLNDIFKPNSPYLKALATYANKSLNTKLKNDNWMISQGTKPELKNFKNWNLQDDSLLITFDEYQVAPYVYGNPEVEIPYTELKKILSEKTPIINCALEPDSCQAIG